MGKLLLEFWALEDVPRVANNSRDREQFPLGEMDVAQSTRLCSPLSTRRQRSGCAAMYWSTHATQSPGHSATMFPNKNAELYRDRPVQLCTGMFALRTPKLNMKQSQRPTARQSTRMTVSTSGRLRVLPRSGSQSLAPANLTRTNPARTFLRPDQSQSAPQCATRSPRSSAPPHPGRSAGRSPARSAPTARCSSATRFHSRTAKTFTSASLSASANEFQKEFAEMRCLAQDQ